MSAWKKIPKPFRLLFLVLALMVAGRYLVHLDQRAYDVFLENDRQKIANATRWNLAINLVIPHAGPKARAIRTEFAKAIETDNVEAVKVLLSREPALIRAQDVIPYRDGGGDSPLMQAASLGSTNVMELLLARGAEVNARSNAGNTPLHFAIMNPDKTSRDSAPMGRRFPCIDILLRHGAEVNIRDESDCTPLFYAAVVREDVKLVEHLLAAGAEMDCGPKHTKPSKHVMNADIRALLLMEPVGRK